MHPVWNILLALIWAAATARFSLINLIIGYAIGFVVLWFMQPIYQPTRYFLKVRRSVRLTLYLMKEIVISNLFVAYDVVTPTLHMKPGIVAIPLDARTELEIAVLANLITLTPGTMSLGVSQDRERLYVHSMFLDKPERLKQQIKSGIERPLLEILR